MRFLFHQCNVVIHYYTNCNHWEVASDETIFLINFPFVLNSSAQIRFQFWAFEKVEVKNNNRKVGENRLFNFMNKSLDILCIMTLN